MKKELEDCSLLVADDHKLFRQGLIKLLSTFPFVGKIREASNGREVLQKVKEEKFDMVLLDLDMPVLNGLETLEKMNLMQQVPAVIIISMHNTPDFVSQSYNNGAKGYLLKETDEKELELALRTVLSGEHYYSATTQLMLFGKKEQEEENQISGGKRQLLSAREIQILRHICEQKTGREIADALSVSEETVNRYRKKLLEKTNCTNMAGLAVFAITNGYYKAT